LASGVKIRLSPWPGKTCHYLLVPSCTCLQLVQSKLLILAPLWYWHLFLRQKCGNLFNQFVMFFCRYFGDFVRKAFVFKQSAQAPVEGTVLTQLTSLNKNEYFALGVTLETQPLIREMTTTEPIQLKDLVALLLQPPQNLFPPTEVRW